MQVSAALSPGNSVTLTAVRCTGTTTSSTTHSLTQLILYQLLTSPVVFSECKLILPLVKYGIFALDLHVSAYGEVCSRPFGER